MSNFTKGRLGKLAIISCALAAIALPLGMSGTAAPGDAVGFQVKSENLEDRSITATVGALGKIAEDPAEADPRGWFQFTVDADGPECLEDSLSRSNLSLSEVAPGTTITDPEGNVTPVTGKTNIGKDGQWTIRGGFGKLTNDTAADLPRNGFAWCMTSVDRWENTGTHDIHGAFRNAISLKTVAEPPSTVTVAHSLFLGARSFDDPRVSDWKLSTHVKGLNGLFYGARSFNQDLSKWDMSEVTSAQRMFTDARAFNQDISGWDVSKITDMTEMFNGADSFSQDLSGWKTCKITERPSIFYTTPNAAREPQWSANSCS